jgi:putative ABC transport system permease protein
VRRLRRLWQKSLTEKRLESELQFHLEQQIEMYVEAGLSREEARRKALLEFGGLERFKEECRDTRWEHHLDVLSRDFRLALRGLRKDRRFAVVAIFALALGIGASTAIFSVVYNALFEPFAYKDSQHLVTMHVRDLDHPDDKRGAFTFDDFQEFRKQNHVFTDMVANMEDDMVYAAGDNSSLFAGNYVAPGTFEFYGVPPFLGRLLEPADYQAGAPPVFVMRYATWVNKFGADASLIGTTFQLNGSSRTLVGIAAPRFAWGGAQLWMPRGPDEPKVNRQGPNQYWWIVARIRPGVSLEQAGADLGVIAQHLSTIHPTDYPKRFAVEVLSFGSAVVPERFRRALYVFSAAVGLLLLIGCGNVANLLLARATTREREFAVRSALGASRSRLVRQLLVESFLLALGGVLVGIFFAWGGVRTIAAVIPDFTIASETVIEMNSAVLIFALAVGVCTVFIFGLAPALQASQCDLNESLRETGKGLIGAGRARLRNAVIVLELALALTLLFTAGLFVRSFVALQHVPLGLRTDHVLSTRLPLPPQRYHTGTQMDSFFRPLLTRLKTVPGIACASATSSLPPYGGLYSVVEVSGKPHSEKWNGFLGLISEDYFSVVRMKLLSGRVFNEREVSAAAHLAVINETFRRRYFGNEDPLGHKIQLYQEWDLSGALKNQWFEIIGIVGDAQNRGLHEPVDPEAWVPYTVTGMFMRGLLVRTANDPTPMLKTVAREIWATDPTVAPAEANTLDYFLDLFTFAQLRFGLWIVGIFAGIGLLLATVGVYSVIAYSTARRTHEIGLRMALGAAAGDVLNMVLRQGLFLLLGGIAFGTGVSLLLGRVIASQLWGVSPYDPVTITGVAMLLLVIGLIACWVPARRATTVNPLAALRCE